MVNFMLYEFTSKLKKYRILCHVIISVSPLFKIFHSTLLYLKKKAILRLKRYGVYIYIYIYIHTR